MVLLSFDFPRNCPSTSNTHIPPLCVILQTIPFSRLYNSPEYTILQSVSLSRLYHSIEDYSSDNHHSKNREDGQVQKHPPQDVLWQELCISRLPWRRVPYYATGQGRARKLAGDDQPADQGRARKVALDFWLVDQARQLSFHAR